LLPRSDEFECQGQRSRVSGTETHCALPSPLQRRNRTRSLQITSRTSRQHASRRNHPGSDGLVPSMFGKTSFPHTSLLVLCMIFHFFICASNISATAERICAKFTGRTCLVPRSDEFDCQGQMSRSPGTKSVLFRFHHPRQLRTGTRWLQMTTRIGRFRSQAGGRG